MGEPRQNKTIGTGNEIGRAGYGFEKSSSGWGLGLELGLGLGN